MGSIRSSITRFLRATVSQRAASVSRRAGTTNNTLIHNHHFLKPTSPLALIRSRPFDRRPHLFSTFAFQSVTPRATKTRLRRLFDKLMYGMFLVVIQICITGVYTFMLVKFEKRCRDNLDYESGTKFKGYLTSFVHKGHTVVIDGFIKPLKRNGVDLGFEYYYIVTEVRSQPDLIVAARERNSYISANKGVKKKNKQQQIVAQEEKKTDVSGDKEDRQVLINWRTTRSGQISNDVADPPLKSKFLLKGLVLEGRVIQSALFYVVAKIHIAKLLHDAVQDFKGLSNALREGHSVVIVRTVNPIKHGFKEEEDKWGKRLVVKVWDSESHVSAQVLDKHDDKYTPRNAVSAAAIEE